MLENGATQPAVFGEIPPVTISPTPPRALSAPPDLGRSDGTKEDGAVKVQ